MIKQKISIYLLITILILSITCILGNRIPEVSASSSSQITIYHKIDEPLENNKVYILNGFKYIYSSTTERFTAMAIDNPETITMIVFYEKINGKQAFYPTDLSLDSYINLEDVIVFYAANVKTCLCGKTIKNLYMANQNNVTNDFSNFQVINYHFVSSYQALYTDITFQSTDYFNAMKISNAYYYDWNKHFFEALANKYHASSGAIHHFNLRSESESSYTKESLLIIIGK